MTRSRTKNALIQLLETIPQNLLADSETKCEDNVLTDNNNETDVEEDFIHISHSDVAMTHNGVQARAVCYVNRGKRNYHFGTN